MQSQELTSLESRLLDPLPIPIIGQCLQKKAVVALAEDRSPEAVKSLAKAVTRLKEPEIKASILDALGKLRNQNCIDVVCEVWADTRHRDLANLLVKKNWIASEPVELRVITALKVNQPQMITNGGKEVIEPLLNAFKDRDSEIANRASECAIIFDKPEYQEFLCRLVIEQDHPIARQVAIKAQYAPREPSQRALFYFLSEQWDKYEILDYEHSLLEKVYELGNEKLRKHIAEKVKQSGRAEWVQIIAGGRKGQRLEKMTDAEWESTLDILSSNKQWEEMWRLAQKAPAIWSCHSLQNLKQVRWQPSSESEYLNFVKLQEQADKCSVTKLKTGELATCQRILTVPGSGLNDISFSPDSQILATCWGYTIQLWRISDSKLISTLTGHTDSVKKASFSPDGQILASCSRDRTIRLWRVSDGKLISTLTGHTDWVLQVCFSPDGQILASCSRDRTIRLWQMPDGKPVSTLARHTNTVYRISFSPDGQILASCGHDLTIRLWQMPEGKLISTRTSGNYVYELRFSPDGQILASCGEYGSIRLWQMSDGKLKLISTFTASTGYNPPVRSMSFSPDGQILASWSEYESIRLWQMSDGKPIATFAHRANFYDCTISFSPDGQILASCGGNDTTINLWFSYTYKLSRLSIQQLSQHHKEWIQNTLQDDKIKKQERYWLEFIQALINWQRRFDVELEDAPQLVSTGEFDIEIEG